MLVHRTGAEYLGDSFYCPLQVVEYIVIRDAEHS